MAKNKEGMNHNLSGLLDKSDMTITYIEKNGGEITYDLERILQRYDGLDIVLTVRTETEIDPI